MSAKTVFSGIVDAFVSALNTPSPVAEVIERDGSYHVSEQISSSVNVFWEASRPQEAAIAGAPIDWQTRIVVDCYGRATVKKGGEAVDELLSSVYARLASDTTLGGSVFNIGTPMIDLETESASQKNGWIRLTYIVEHRTTEGVLYV